MAVDGICNSAHQYSQCVLLLRLLAGCCRADPATETAERLLEHLLTVAAGSQDMTAKLQLLQQRLPALHDVGLISSWRQFWASASWAHITNTANLLTKSNLAVQVCGLGGYGLPKFRSCESVCAQDAYGAFTSFVA